jgi:molybdopterin synthase sulfur carrier subunit
MRIHVRYFASLRELLGPDESIDVPDGCTVGRLRDLLMSRGERHARALQRGRALRAALDQRMADESDPLHDGAEVAFFPPVTGG